MTVHSTFGTAGARAQRALTAMTSGTSVIMIDDQAEESTGFLVMPAEAATTSAVAFFVRHSSGFLCVALPRNECERLRLPTMIGSTDDPSGLTACVTVDAANGVSTGISAHDRARAVTLLGNPTSSHDDFTRPGHVIPVQTADGGVLRRAGIAEAAADLAHAAEGRPVALFAALVSVSRPTELASGTELGGFADTHGLVTVSVSDLSAFRMSREPLVSRQAAARLPLRAGDVRTVGYHGVVDDAEHVALLTGEPADVEDVPVYVHQECLIGDVFGSLRCGCRYQLDSAVATIVGEGCGVVVYLRSTVRDTECGSLDRTRSQDSSVPFMPAVAAHILEDLGARSIRLLEDDAEQRTALQDRGLPTRIHGLAVAAIS